MSSGRSQATPWEHESSFNQVCHLIECGTNSKWRRALAQLELWKQRVHRLPSGVETTSMLLECLVQEKCSSLSLSAALTRFLNLVSQAFERHLNLGRMADLAAKLNIPADLVHLRHESTHGHMPDKDALNNAVRIALKWLIINFWRQESKAIQEFLGENQENQSQMERFATKYSSKKASFCRNLMDCHLYLKIYSLWGHQQISELKSQRDLYRHVCENWKSCFGDRKSRPFFEDSTLQRALTKLMGEIKRFLDQKGDDNGEIMVSCLVNDELLMPAEDFVRNLVSQEKKDDQILPLLLKEAWIDILAMIFKAKPKSVHRMIEMLLRLNNNEQALAWAVFLLEQIVNTDEKEENNGGDEHNKDTYKKNKRRRKMAPIKSPNKKSSLLGVTRKDIMTSNWHSVWLNQLESPKSIPLLRALSKLVDVSSDKSEKAIELASIFMGNMSHSDKPVKENEIIRTVADMCVLKPFGSANNWTLASDVDWSKLPIGLNVGQSADSLHSFLSMPNKEEIEDADSIEDRIIVITTEDENSLSVDWDTLNRSSKNKNT